MKCSFYISVCAQEIAPDAACTALIAADSDDAQGASACFIGRVRGGDVRAVTLEHYPAMTENALAQIARDAAARWPLAAAHIIHRVGRLLPGEVIVFVGVQSRHRQAAFSACAYMTDYLKTRAPFWKKEDTAAGARWVAARAGDEDARRRWDE